jgi:hypothetical protein
VSFQAQPIRKCSNAAGDQEMGRYAGLMSAQISSNVEIIGSLVQCSPISAIDVRVEPHSTKLKVSIAVAD